jgi:hypothetical protein
MIPHYKEMFQVRLQFLELALPTVDGNRWLRSQLIDIAHATNVAGPIIEMEITSMPGGYFSFCEDRDGFMAFVMMVFDRDAETPIDFIAWTRDKPRRVFRYFGYADAFGVDQLYNPTSYYDDNGLMIRRTPMDWLFAGCTGAVILDYEEFGQRLHAARDEIPQCRLVGESLSHAREISKTLKPLPDNVRIFVPASQLVAA